MGAGIDWRRALIYTHRWLGIAGCLVFLVWFVSGVVMMYARMPRLTAEERLWRLPPLDAGAVRVPLATAAAVGGVEPDRVRVGMLLGRPVYRFSRDGQWSVVFADTGMPLGGLTPEAAVQAARAFVPEAPAKPRHVARLERPDQWTLDGGLPRYLPLHRIALGDAAGSELYVSDRTGEVVMTTTARSRFWGYAGAVLHWTYFPRLREQRELWRYGIIYTALAGCVMCLSGLVAGIWRWSPSKRFRLKRVPSHSPYAGLMWWHHYAGLLFGVFAFTWSLSGALSLTPWDWAPSTDPTPAQAAVVSGGPLRLDEGTPERLRAAASSIAMDFEPKELEILQFQGRVFAAAFRAPRREDAASWTNPDVRAFQSPQLGIEQRLVWLDAPSMGTFRRLDRAAVTRVARAAMPGTALQDAAWLEQYDAYYYDRWGAKPLPVLRARFGDAEATWLYLDPQSGLITLRHTRLSRVNRWLYNGLHSLDLPFLYFRRPAWDVTLLGLSAGGLALILTTMVPAWRRLRRHAARLRPGRTPGTAAPE